MDNYGNLEFKMKNKKGLDAPSNLVIIVLFVAILAILIMLAFYFGTHISESGTFRHVTNFTERFGGW